MINDEDILVPGQRWENDIHQKYSERNTNRNVWIKKQL